jgi:hypothetical protein
LRQYTAFAAFAAFAADLHGGGRMNVYCTCTRCGCTFEREADQKWKRLCLDCWLASKGKERAPPPPPPPEPAPRIEAEMLGRLIRLCHPDKHGNSEASNTATKWLLAQRELARENQCA